MAGQPVVAANAPAPSDYSMALQGYGPQTAAAIQHSQYLAQAMAAMQQQGQNIRTPVALAGDLAAALMLNGARQKSYGDLAKAVQADRAARYQDDDNWASDMSARIAGGQAPPAQTAAAPDASSSPPPPPAAPTPQSAAAAPQPDYAPNFGDPHQDPAAFFGEALGGKPVTITSGLRTPQQNAAVGGSPTSSHLTGNAWDFTVPGMSSAQTVDALRQSGMPFDQIIDEGRNVHVGMDPRMRGMVMAGGGGHYRVLDHDTFGAPQPGAAGMDPGRATTPGGQLSYSQDGQPGPLQTATVPQSTPTPSPSPSASGVPAPGGPAGAPPAAASPAAGGASPPLYAPIDPGQIQLARHLLHTPYPEDQQKGHQMMMELRQASVTQIKPETQVVGDQVVSRDPYGRGVATAAPIQGYRAPAPAGMQWGEDGHVHPIPGTEFSPLAQASGTNTLGQYGPDGQFHAGPQVEFGPEKRIAIAQGLQHELTDSDIYKKFSEGRSALVGFRNALSANGFINNGVLNTAAVDSYLRSVNPGMGAKQSTVANFLDHLGLPQEIQSHILSITGNGYLTPQTLQQMDQVMQAYTAAHGAEVQKLHQGHVTIAQQAGIDEKGLGENVGDIPQPLTLNFNGRQSPAQAGASAAQTARTAGASVANAAANLPRLSPEQAARLPAGTPFLTLDGRPRTAHGPRQ